MLYSKLFGKTVKTIPNDATFVSNKLLYQAGFIRESTAGRYFFLPLGIKVQQKIMKIIKEEMDASGAQEIVTPVLHPLELWQETNRDKSTGYELMKVEDRHGAKFALGGTAEEMLVDVVRKFQISYKDLPFNLYQFSSKFRDELRARGGLLRVREFMMKDAYSFDVNDLEFKKVYRKMQETYMKIFERLGLKTIIVEADNGYIGGDYSHEFVVESDAGETNYYFDTKTNKGIQVELAEKLTKEQKNKMVLKKGIEVGNVFQLGYYYSKKMKDATFTDKDGTKKPYYMGCYGIGIGRTMAAIIESCNDERGIVWPESVAPYRIHLVGLNLNEESINKQAFAVYEKLKEAGIEVLFDDRIDASAGEKFGDADLIGIPYRLVVSKRTGDKMEFKKRTEKESKLLDIPQLLNYFIT